VLTKAICARCRRLSDGQKIRLPGQPRVLGVCRGHAELADLHPDLLAFITVTVHITDDGGSTADAPRPMAAPGTVSPARSLAHQHGRLKRHLKRTA
jgi:hypothetical protein